MRNQIVAATLLILSTTTAHAQDWTYTAALNGWLPGVSGTIETAYGELEVEPGGDSAFDLQAGFLGTFAARRGKWTFAADLLYANLGASQDTPFGLLFDDATVEEDLKTLSAYALYRVTDTPQVQVDVGAGFRSFDVGIGVDLSAGALPAVGTDISASWTDPLIAARVHVPLGEKFFVSGVADWGGTTSGDETWQIYGGVGYKFTQSFSTEIGYRRMDVRTEIQGLDVDLSLTGGMMVFAYQF